MVSERSKPPNNAYDPRSDSDSDSYPYSSDCDDNSESDSDDDDDEKAHEVFKNYRIRGNSAPGRMNNIPVHDKTNIRNRSKTFSGRSSKTSLKTMHRKVENLKNKTGHNDNRSHEELIK